MPQFKPWTNSRFGSPRAESPAFQREWKSFNTSAVQIRTGTGPPSSLVVNNAVAGELSSTIYVWGASLSTTSTNPQAVEVLDEDGTLIFTMIASANGPFMLNLSTPIKIADNKALEYKRTINAGSTNGTYITIQTVSTNLKYE